MSSERVIYGMTNTPMPKGKNATESTSTTVPEVGRRRAGDGNATHLQTKIQRCHALGERFRVLELLDIVVVLSLSRIDKNNTAHTAVRACDTHRENETILPQQHCTS